MKPSAVDKSHIVAEIVRTAQENGGRPVGKAAFTKLTGIKESDWFGKYWKAWGHALQEAGFEPNKLNQQLNENLVLEKLIELIRELNPPRMPVSGDFRIKARACPGFPSHTVFEKLGGKPEKAAKLLAYCRTREGYNDVAEICQSLAPCPKSQGRATRDIKALGVVYVVRSGRYYKIGFTNSIGRREYELKIQLPERAVLIHKIQTDDPEGIEAYWHKRFQAKRKNGEWFALDVSDVAALKRRTFM